MKTVMFINNRKEDFMYNLGLVSVSFRQSSPEGLLKLCRENGLSFIEWGSDVHAPQKDIQRLEKIAEMQEKYGIKCSSYGTYFRLGATPIEELADYISAAKILGTDTLRFWCGVKGSADYTDVEWEDLMLLCKSAAAIAEKESVKLCMECHNGTVTDTLDSALKLMNSVSSKSFRMYWQPNQYRTFEENCTYAEKIAPFTENLHVFNWQGDNRYPLEDGLDLWKKYLSYFGNDKTLLLEFMPDDKTESLAAEAETLKKL